MRVLTWLFLIGFSFSTQAADLTGKDIEAWLNSIHSIQTWLMSNEEKMPDGEPPSDPYDMEQALQYSINLLKKAGLYTEFEQQLKNQGYANVDSWSQLSTRISLAYMALEQEAEPVTRAQIQEQIQAVNSLNIPAEGKASLQQMLSSSLKMLDRIEAVSATDKAAARPYFERLQEQMGENHD